MEVEAYGVNAAPEKSEHEIRGSDAFILLASDGLFEFLTSQQVLAQWLVLRGASPRLASPRLDTPRQSTPPPCLRMQVVTDISTKLESGSSLLEALWAAVKHSANIWKEYDQVR